LRYQKTRGKRSLIVILRSKDQNSQSIHSNRFTVSVPDSSSYTYPQALKKD
jgi:hypothetical protein